jgi:hypothetical protein
MITYLQMRRTPLLISCQKFDVSMISLLLTKGAKIGSRAEVGLPRLIDATSFEVFRLDRLPF